MKSVNFSLEFYDHLAAAADHFNGQLFKNRLPSPLFTLKRGLGSLGHFNSRRWATSRGKPVGEISLNPTLFGQFTWLQLMMTIAQQQCHLWQHAYGTPSRPGYHNAEWASKMEEIGLVPSSTGQPGGRRTGQQMSAYPVAGGAFILACEELSSRKLRPPLSMRWNTTAPTAPPTVPTDLARGKLNFMLSPIGSWSDDASVMEGEELAVQKRKLKYSCPQCDVNVWGRPGLRLLCSGCSVALRESLGRKNDASATA